MGKFGAVAKVLKGGKNTSKSPKPQTTKPNSSPKKQENKQKKDNQQGNDIPPTNVSNGKSKKQASVSTKSKRKGDIIDSALRAMQNRDDANLKSLGNEAPKYGGFFAIYHDLSYRYAKASALRDKHNTGMFSKIAKGAGLAIGASAMAYAAYSTLGADFLGSKQARLLDKDSKIEDELQRKEQDNFHKGLVVENLSDDLGIEASNTRELANGLKNVDNGKEILDDLINEVCIEALKDSTFSKNIENLEKSVLAVEKAFGLDNEQIKSQNLTTSNENIANLAFGDTLNGDKKQNLINALNKFHTEVQDTGNINLNNLESVLKQANFSDEEIKKVIDTIDNERKSNPNYLVHNANVFASISDKKEQIALVKELIAKGKDITNDDIAKFVEAHGYKGLMAVAKNMNIDGSMSKTEKALSMLRGSEGDTKYKEALRNPNFLNMKALELPTLLETADILNNGEVSMVKNTKQEQMGLEQLHQPNLVNPYTLGNRGEMSAYFRDKNGNVVADNTIGISTISEGKTNLANILDYSTNEKAMANILTALKNEASSTFKNNGYHEDLSSKKSVKSNIDDFLASNMEISSMIKKDASPSEIQKQMATMNTNLKKSVLSTEQKNVLSSGVDMFRISQEILHNQSNNSMKM